jgi:hypothetical protein
VFFDANGGLLPVSKDTIMTNAVRYLRWAEASVKALYPRMVEVEY